MTVPDVSAEFKDNIRDWVNTDNAINELNAQLKKLRERRSILQANITSFASENDLMKARVKLNDGAIVFKETSTPAPLSLKYIEKCLTDLTENKEHIQNIMDYIRDNRAYYDSVTIKRTVDKTDIPQKRTNEDSSQEDEDDS